VVLHPAVRERGVDAIEQDDEGADLLSADAIEWDGVRCRLEQRLAISAARGSSSRRAL
jgi:hypothetical protein